MGAWTPRHGHQTVRGGNHDWRTHVAAFYGQVSSIGISGNYLLLTQALLVERSFLEKCHENKIKY